MLKSFGIFLILVIMGVSTAVAEGVHGDFRFIIGAANPGLNDLNDYYLDGFAVPTGLTNENFGSSLMWGFDLSYPTLGGRLRAGFFGLSTGVNGKEELDIEFISQSTATYIADSDFDVRCAVVMLRAEKTFQVWSRTTWIGGGPLYGWGKVDLRTDWLDTEGFVAPSDQRAKYDADGIGMNIAGGVELVSLGPVFSSIEAGYNWLDLGNLRDDSGAYWRLDTTNPGRALGLDLSGPYIVLATGFKF